MNVLRCTRPGWSLLLFLACSASACGPSDRSGSPSLATPANLDVDLAARGQYLTEGLLQCLVCHSERDWDEPGAPPVEGREGAGKVFRQDGEYRLVAGNITPDPETGIGDWTDEELDNAIRHGVGRDGRRLDPLMYANAYRHLTDRDLRAVIAFLRSLEPIRNPLPATRPRPEDQEKLDARDPFELEPLDPSVSDPIASGRALVALGDCRGCHTAWSGSGGGLFSGGDRIERAGRVAFSSNLTSDPSGIPYGADAFVGVMRTGKGGTLSPLMPWTAFRHLRDRDLRAIYAYLQTFPPIRHYVDNRSPPTYCEVCGQEHGLGELNEMALLTNLRLRASSYPRYAGTYHSDDEGFDLTVEPGPEHLTIRMNGAHPTDLLPLSNTRFLVPRLRRSVRFEFDGPGPASRLVVENDPDVVLERIAPTVDSQRRDTSVRSHAVD